ncbi:ornithine racemase Orr [Senegalia massiliensis]|jgi:predicted amino acid racemase|uniref:ornithine racemase Orr n=1 Tax=Senegalia massiliensis TaxID=1720316 RepID=UPI0010308649|nr:ornithine racemase Orr [Senegalia massiliensis]
MNYPSLIIDSKKLKENVEVLMKICKKHGINAGGVTKVFSGDIRLSEIFVQGGVSFLADSRIENLITLEKFNLPKIMLRLPMISEAEKVVRYADISLNSELSTIKELSREGEKQNKVHDIILMVDLGDLREGIFEETEIYELITEIITLKGVRLIGLGTNLTCYGGVIPRRDNLRKLAEIKEKIEEEFEVQIEILSGGNSSSLYLLETDDMPGEINQLRLGEALILGRETAFGHQITGTHNDVFELEAEIIELKSKPSIPIGEIGMDAFGRKPSFIDKGNRKRAICAIGKQDIDVEDLFPKDENIAIIGQSSDHLIIDVTDSISMYKTGDIIKFGLNYGGILKLMTSSYVSKNII